MTELDIILCLNTIYISYRKERWPIRIMNSVVKTKSSCKTLHWHRSFFRNLPPLTEIQTGKRPQTSRLAPLFGVLFSESARRQNLI